MKTIILGDTHGRIIWKDIINQNPDYDKIVFIGDYVDTHEDISPIQQLENLADIIQFKKDNPNKVILLIGNHDFHYLDVDERYSGFQYTMKFQFGELFKDNLNLFQICIDLDRDVICSHAGISKTWCENNNIHWDETLDLVCKEINELFKYKPYAFKFKGLDPYGDSFESSPIWIRPYSLQFDGLSCTQIMGHTTQNKIKKIDLSLTNILDSEYSYYLIDTLGTSGEYLVIQDNEIIITNSKI